MIKLLLMLVAVLAGAAGACQAAANAALAGRAGLGTALLLNTALVLAGVTALFFATGGPRTLGAVAGAPLSHYVGGLCGFFIIATITFAFPRVGGGVALAAMVMGMGLMGLIIDHYGLWGMRLVPVTASRLAGVACLVAGVVLMRR
jgi:transporter family-2 protein